VRSLVSRRLRHLLRDRLPWLPDGVRVVVRAAPGAAVADSAALGRDLDGALARALRPPGPPRGAPPAPRAGS
jgi:ribonuclease P protein component